MRFIILALLIVPASFGETLKEVDDSLVALATTIVESSETKAQIEGRCDAIITVIKKGDSPTLVKSENVNIVKQMEELKGLLAKETDKTNLDKDDWESKYVEPIMDLMKKP